MRKMLVLLVTIVTVVGFVNVVGAENKKKKVLLQTFVNSVAGRTYQDIVARFGDPSCKGSRGIIYNDIVKDERTGEILSVYIDFQPGFPVGTVIQKEGRMVVGFSDLKYLASNIICRYYDFEVRDAGDPVVQNFRVYRSVNKQGWVPSCDVFRGDERAQQEEKRRKEEDPNNEKLKAEVIARNRVEMEIGNARVEQVLSNQKPVRDKKIVTVTWTSAIIRSGVGNDYPVVTSVNQGDKLTVIGESGEWLNVQLENNKQGWISNRVVK